MEEQMRRALGAVGFLINQHDLQDRAGQFLVYLRIHRPGVRGVFYEVWTSLPYLFRLELLTLLQVVGTCICYTVLYGIINNLHTTNIDFDFFSTNKTHIGPMMERLYPSVYKKKVPWHFAVILGTLTTWWMGFIFGFIVAAMRQKNNMPLTQLHLPLSAGCLATCIVVSGLGEAVQSATADGFLTVALMHNFAYIGGPLIVLYVLGAYIKIYAQQRVM